MPTEDDVQQPARRVGAWADSVDTMEGHTIHRGVHRPSRDPLPPSEWSEAFAVRRSVRLGSERCALSDRQGAARVDTLREAIGNEADGVGFVHRGSTESQRSTWAHILGLPLVSFERRAGTV